MHFHVNFAAISTLFAIFTNLSQCEGNNTKERNRGKLGGASRDASKAECAKTLDIKLYKDSPGILRFKPDKKACKAGPSYVGSTEDGKCHVTLVSGNGNATSTFAASVTCDNTGAVYSIGTDGNGTMTVVERHQEDYGAELDPFDEVPIEERALLEARFTTLIASSTSGLRGKVANQLSRLGDRFLTDNHGEYVHQDLAGNVIIDALVLYTADAECANAGQALGCVRNPTTEASIRSKINLAVAETNTAYSLSGVNVVLNLVHATYDDYIETDEMGVTLTTLQSRPSVQALREAYGADVVAMITGRGGYCGLGYMGPSKNFMYSVTAHSCATGYYSFGHEIGHNFGLNHDRGPSNACANSGYNYGYRDPQAEFRSILAYSCTTGQCTGYTDVGSCTRVQRFSNSYALYNGKPIGDANNDNARHINDVASEVSNFFSRPLTPSLQPATSPPTSLSSKPTSIPTSRPTTRNPTTVKPTFTPTSPGTNKPTSLSLTLKPTTKRPTTRNPTSRPTTRTPTSRPSSRTPTSNPTTSTPTTESTVANGTFMGCYGDDYPRDLIFEAGAYSNLTNSMCIQLCKENGYQYAGTQYYEQCFCGNSYGAYYPEFTDPTGCNTPCSGNANEICGGSWHNSVYNVN